MKIKAQVLLASICTLPFLAGCGTDVFSTSSTGALKLTGKVHGGQQAISGAQIHLYDVGKTGNGSAATDLITAANFSDGNGNFLITGDYTCPNVSDQVYLVANGGNPGTANPNASIALVTALGSCGNLASSTYITLNELTTVAAAWSLAAFATGPANIGTSSTNALGITNAMSNSTLLVNSADGTPATVAGQTIETSKLNTLADALATCVNSDGTGTGCNNLFTAATPPSGSAPADTFTAALNIVHYPANNVATIFGTVPGQPPFAPALTAAPNDWTMSDTIALPGASPQQLAIDGTGTVWTADSRQSLLFAVAPQGALLNSSGYGSGVLANPSGVTVDAAGNVWVSNSPIASSGNSVNSGNGFLAKFQSTTGSAAGTAYMTGVGSTPYYYDANTSGPYFLAADAPTTSDPATGNVVFVDYNSLNGIFDVEVFTDAGATSTFTSQGGGPTNAIFDSTHGLWIPDYSGTDVIHYVNGSATPVSCCHMVGVPSGNAQGTGLGLDLNGNLWINSADANGTGYISEISNANNTVLINSETTDNIASAAVAGDAGGVMWFANTTTTPGSIAAISSSTGTSVSPSTGFGLDASIGLPVWIAPDASGNLWLSDSSKGNLVLFFGLATPTTTPQLALPTAP